MNEEEYFEQLCSNSVDGTLTDSEKQKLEEHLAECPSCAALKEDLEQMHSMPDCMTALWNVCGRRKPFGWSRRKSRCAVCRCLRW